MDDPEGIRRLRWQCRRGMLELDHLFGRFFELGFAELGAEGRRQFSALLGEQDQDLHRWLVSRSVEPPRRYCDLIERIREVVAAEPPRL